MNDRIEQRLDDLRVQALATGRVDGRGVAVEGGPIPPGTVNPLQKAGGKAADRPGYYGLPVVKPPVWTWEIPVYFFIGGLSGMAAVIALMAWMFREPELARAAVWTSAVGAGMLSPALLIMDLGRPSLFLNMLRVFKHRSAMSMGAWILSALGAVVVPAAFAVELSHWHLLEGGWQRALGILIGLLLLASAPLGTLLATYTGVLIGATAVPAWFTHRTLLPAHFGMAGLGAAAGWLQLMGWRLRSLHVIGLAAAGAETFFWLWLLLRRQGAADRALHDGRVGALLQTAEICTGPLPLLLLTMGWTAPGSAVFLAGAFLNRFGWLAAGRASARDPKAVFASQG